MKINIQKSISVVKLGKARISYIFCGRRTLTSKCSRPEITRVTSPLIDRFFTSVEMTSENF